MPELCRSCKGAVPKASLLLFRKCTFFFGDQRSEHLSSVISFVSEGCVFFGDQRIRSALFERMFLSVVSFRSQVFDFINRLLFSAASAYNVFNRHLFSSTNHISILISDISIIHFLKILAYSQLIHGQGQMGMAENAV